MFRDISSVYLYWHCTHTCTIVGDVLHTHRSQQLSLLTGIIRNKNTCKAFMNNTIYSALVTISQKMNIGIPIEEGSRQRRHCVTWTEVIKALKDKPSEEMKHLAVHF